MRWGRRTALKQCLGPSEYPQQVVRGISAMWDERSPPQLILHLLNQFPLVDSPPDACKHLQSTPETTTYLPGLSNPHPPWPHPLLDPDLLVSPTRLSRPPYVPSTIRHFHTTPSSPPSPPPLSSQARTGRPHEVVLAVSPPPTEISCASPFLLSCPAPVSVGIADVRISQSHVPHCQSPLRSVRPFLWSVDLGRSPDPDSGARGTLALGASPTVLPC